MSEAIHCPSIGSVTEFTHEPCARAGCSWWSDRCTAADTIPVGRLRRRKPCGLATRCRWALQVADGVCPPMKLGEICEHQGGAFNTFMLEGAR
ncbi:MAG TPA: hypothetical protein VFO62_10740 [Candidatus Binatia bacterium]|nr:hypothetical protein [Candidatus Binatia bacterium]